jgi:RNA polymerase sigma factor (sigma-70 family)
MPRELSDSELIERLKTRNDEEKKDIFLTLYDRYKNLVLKISYEQLHDYDRAGDVLHDVFVRVIEDFAGIKDGAVFKSWIMAVTRNRCVDLLRKTSYLKNYPLDATIQVRLGERMEDVLIASMDRQKILRLLSSCIQGLDEFHLNILKLRWKGLRSTELSKTLSIDKMEIRRSYDKIKRVLEGCMRSKGLTISIDQIISLGELDE